MGDVLLFDHVSDLCINSCGLARAPGLARISWGAWVCFMASSWHGFKVERKESNEINTTI
jgi:hypothetical protein